MKKRKNKLLDKPLNNGEKKLMESVENVEWDEHELAKKERKAFIQAARNSLKDTKMNIRISSSDKEELEKMAAEEGIPYQTFIRSILHKYRAGQLIDIKSAKKVLSGFTKVS